MTNQIGLIVGIVVVVLIGIFVWRLFNTANKGIDAVAGTANDVIAAVKPITAAVGNALDGAGRVVHGGADLVDVLVDSVRNKQKERVQLAAENAELRAQIEQLKTRRVEATNVARALEIAFFSVTSKYTSFKKHEEKVGDGGLMGLERRTLHQYVGVIEADFKMKVGVDLKSLRFGFKAGEKTIYVHGAHVVQFIGMKDIQFTRPFQEARMVYESNARREGAIEALSDGEFLAKAALSHNDEVLQEIQNSKLASSLEDANQTVAINLFNAIMGAGRYTFKPQADPIDHALDFDRLCDLINSETADQIGRLETMQDENLSRAQLIDEEIFNLAIAGRGHAGQAQQPTTQTQALRPRLSH